MNDQNRQSPRVAKHDDPRILEARRMCLLMEECGYPTCLAGGCVRDLLLGCSPKDIDLATAARPEQVRKIFLKQGFGVLPTGLKHGTQTVLTGSQAIEVTTLRSDLGCDGRHAEVEFCTDFELDARRRDFTINAMYQDGHGRIYDFVGGRRDLEQQVLRFVGKASDRIGEDYLRILRYFRFLARFGWDPLPDQLDAIERMRDGIATLSGERIKWELDLILAGRHAPEVIHLMHQAGVCHALFPWWTKSGIGTLAAALRFLVDDASASVAYLRLFAVFLLGGSGSLRVEDLNARMGRLPFRRREKRILERLCRLVQSRLEPLSAIRAVLDLCERGEVDPASLHSFLMHLSGSLKFDWHPVIPLLLQGLGDKSDSPPTVSQLLELPRRARGPVHRVLKSLFYLNVWTNADEAAEILADPRGYVASSHDAEATRAPPGSVIDPLILVLKEAGANHAE